jgi:hypothetical protein
MIKNTISYSKALHKSMQMVAKLCHQRGNNNFLHKHTIHTSLLISYQEKTTEF